MILHYSASNYLRFCWNPQFLFSQEISVLGFSTSRKKICQQILFIKNFFSGKKPICVKIFHKQNGRWIHLSKKNEKNCRRKWRQNSSAQGEQEKNKKQNGVRTPLVDKEDKKGLNDDFLTDKTGHKRVVARLFCIGILSGLKVTESETYLKFLRRSKFTDISKPFLTIRCNLDLYFCMILCWRCILFTDLNFVRGKCGFWKEATKLPWR